MTFSKRYKIETNCLSYSMQSIFLPDKFCPQQLVLYRFHTYDLVRFTNHRSREEVSDIG